MSVRGGSGSGATPAGANGRPPPAERRGRPGAGSVRRDAMPPRLLPAHGPRHYSLPLYEESSPGWWPGLSSGGSRRSSRGRKISHDHSHARRTRQGVEGLPVFHSAGIRGGEHTGIRGQSGEQAASDPVRPGRGYRRPSQTLAAWPLPSPTADQETPLARNAAPDMKSDFELADDSRGPTGLRVGG